MQYHLCMPSVRSGRKAQADGNAGAALIPDLDTLREFLARQEKDRLIDLLLEQALTDERLFQHLAAKMASEGSAGRPDVAAIRRLLAAAFRTGDFLTYHEVSGYAEDLDLWVDRLEEILDEGYAEEAIELTEYALEQTEEALEQVDDSDNEVGAVLSRLQDLHLAACKRARPDPVTLARRLFAWELRTSWDTFYEAADTYADVLGDEGRAEYLRLAEAEWEKLPALGPGDTGSFDGNRFRVASILESFARASGDPDALAAVKARDLSNAFRYLAIAEVYQQAGQEDRALEWAEKGVRAFPNDTDPRLRTFLADHYQARGRQDEALNLLWANFTDHPSVDAYRELKLRAERAGDDALWQTRALTHLRGLAAAESRRQQDSPWSGMGRGAAGLLVHVLLHESDLEAAWAAAQEFGCSEDLWLDLARRRERAHPEDALPIYQRAVKSALQTGSGWGYQRAVEHLQRIRDLMKRTGQSREFAAYLASVRQEHKRKRNFMKLLEEADLK